MLVYSYSVVCYGEIVDKVNIRKVKKKGFRVLVVFSHTIFPQLPCVQKVSFKCQLRPNHGSRDRHRSQRSLEKWQRKKIIKKVQRQGSGMLVLLLSNRKNDDYVFNNKTTVFP